MRDSLILIPEIFIMFVICALGLYLPRRLYHIVTNTRFYNTNSQQDKATQMLLKAGLNQFFIIKHPQVSFSVGFQKYFKTKTNILRYAKCIGEIKIPDAWLQILKSDRLGAIRLAHIYEHKLLAKLAILEMNLHGFVVPQ